LRWRLALTKPLQESAGPTKGLRAGIWKNTVALAVPNAFNPLVSFLLVLVISRKLGVGGLGVYSLVLSYISLFITFASLGLSPLIVREAARRADEANVFLFNAALFGTASSTVSVLALNILVAAMGYEKEVVLAAFVYSFSLVASTVMSYLEGIFRSSEISEYVAITYLVENTLRVGISVALLFFGYGVISVFVTMLGTRIFAVLLMSSFYLNVLKPQRPRLKPEIWRLLAKESLTFASIAIFSSVYLGIDEIMLSKLASIESVGIYSAADRLVQICKTLPLAFAAALLPVMTKEHVVSVDRLRELSTSSLQYVLLGTIPVAIGTAILADQIVALIYGQKFTASTAVLRLHIFSLLPVSMAYLMAEVLIVTDNQRVDLWINIVGAGINLVLNFVFIRALVEVGAALATLVTMIFFNAIQYWYIRRHLFAIPFLEVTTKTFIAAMGMGALTYGLREWNIFANVIVSAVFFFSLLVLLDGLPRELREYLIRIVPGRGPNR